MKNDVAKFVAACLTCQKSKVKHQWRHVNSIGHPSVEVG